MVDWSKLPDLSAVALLAWAFASVSRRSQTPVSGLWLTGWLMIALHFGAFMFLQVPGRWGLIATFVGLAALVWAGVLFMWASVPYRTEPSSQFMLAAMLATNTLYLAAVTWIPTVPQVLNISAALFGVLPLAITLWRLRRFNHWLRWCTVSLYSALSVFLLLVQNRPSDGADLALNAVLFTVYFACCIHFTCMYWRATTGAFITSAGFLAWAAVFVVAPSMSRLLPELHLESEVWNLPKYVVAAGMILLLLENQIEENKFLALHDELTGLPNRRLFQDRLARSIERARRSKTHTALLLVDLNRFKDVNDALGHHAGDLLLQHVGSVFKARVRRSDTVARTGGDEFCIILEEPTSRADAERVGKSLLKLLDVPIELEGYSVRVGASVGIALYPEDAEDTETLAIKADLEMYASKHAAADAAVKESFCMPDLLPLTLRGARRGTGVSQLLASDVKRALSSTRDGND